MGSVFHHETFIGAGLGIPPFGVGKMKGDIQELKGDMREVKGDMRELKSLLIQALQRSPAAKL